MFQRTAISCDDIEPVDWRFLEKKDLVSLGKLVKLEFKEDIHRGMKHRRHLSDATRDFPHIHDIFTMEPLLQRQNIQLAVCVQYNRGAGGHFMWRDKNQTFYPMDPVRTLYYVSPSINNLTSFVFLTIIRYIYFKSPFICFELDHYRLHIEFLRVSIQIHCRAVSWTVP